MSKRRMIGIALWIVAIAVIAGGYFMYLSGHVKSGIGLIGLGVVAAITGLIAFFVRASAHVREPDEVSLYKDLM